MRITLPALVLFAVITAPATAAPPPAIYNLGTLGGTNSFGRAVNNGGQVAGYSSVTGDFPEHAFRYDGTTGSGGVLRDLGTLGGARSRAMAVNAAGQVAGHSDIAGSPWARAFRYDGTPGAGGVMHNLGTLGGDSSVANGINDVGQVVGRSFIPSSVSFGGQHAFRYDGTPGAGGVMHDLGAFPRQPGSTPFAEGVAVNNAGQVAGFSEIGGGAYRAFRYDGTPGAGGVMHGLSGLGFFGWSFGDDINDAGQVAGSGQVTGSTAYHAFRYDGTPGADGVMRDLGTLGGTNSHGKAINDAGQVAGFSEVTGSSIFHAFLYTGTPGADGKMIDLDTWLDVINPTEGAKWTLSYAEGLSNTGWITGTGTYDPDGPGGVAAADRAYLLDASSLVPEPSVLALLGVGAVTLLRHGRRSSRPTLWESLERRRLLSFSTAVNYAVGSGPYDVVTADFNVDGIPDLATANYSGSTVSVLLGNANGTFQPARTFATGTNPLSLAVGDFNGDEKLDVATANKGASSVSVLLGTGTGTFQPPTSVGVGQTPTSVAVGDFNGDGTLDLGVTSAIPYEFDPDLGYSYTITANVLLGNGIGGFSGPNGTWLGDGYGISTSAIAANLDGVGPDELVVANTDSWNYNGDVAILTGDASGVLQVTHVLQTGASAYGVAVGDVNADDTLDIVTANWSHASVSVLLGDGLGGHGAAQSFAAGSDTHSLALGDFTGDGNVDIAVTDFYASRVNLLVGEGGGTFTVPTPFATGLNPASLASGDFDSDGWLDMATANYGGSSVSVLINNGLWGTTPTKTFTGPGGNGNGGNWSNPGNWSPTGVPGPADIVSIGGGKSVNLGGSATVAGLMLVNGATLTVASNGSRVLRTASLDIAGTSKLNLNDNDLILDYDGSSPLGSWNGSAYGGVTGLVARGYAYGDWTGDGLVTTASQAQAGVATLAVAEASQLFELSGTQTALFGGQTIDATTVVVKYTYSGDVNLDGTIDGADYGVIDNWVQFPGTNRYENGDFNFDGVIDGADYGIIDNAIQFQGGVAL